VIIHGVRNLSGVSGVAKSGVQIPAPPRPVADSAKARADSAKKPDATKKPDAAKKP
jgi:hypothetical protein